MGKKVLEIDVLDVEKRRVPSKHYVYVILVKWSDGLTLTVFRRYSRFFDLQARLLELFPIEGGTIAPEKRIIPFLPGKIFFGRSHIKDVAMKRLDDIRAYCKSLVKLPAHISECEEVTDFFEVEPEDLDPPTEEDNKSKSTKEKKAEKISKPKQPDRYVAVADYEAQAPGEMMLYPGLRVDVLEKSDSGWWFVNSEDEQGWVPSTYLEPEGGAAEDATPAAIAEPGQEENFICIEKFEGASADEVSLEKGSVVQVIQKNMDGWWLVRYMGVEGFAPGTYLKKATDGQALSLAEKSRLSGVQIISSLQDVSTLLSKENKDESPSMARKSTVNSSTPTSAVVKTRSLERGGSLIPPPRTSSVMKVDAPLSVIKSSIYVTIEDFVDTVGDGLSFQTGQKVHVKEKTPTGWWFVDIDGQEGWVPASYLQSCSEQEDADDAAAPAETSDHDDDFSDEDWYDHPDMPLAVPHSPLGKGNSHGYMDIGKRPLPPIPPEEEEEAPKPLSATNSPRMAHRPLPATPGASSEPSVKKRPELPIPKKPSQTQYIPPTPPAKGLKPKTGGSSKEVGPKPAAVGGGGDEQDLASVLKAKFAARTGASPDNVKASEEASPKALPDKPKVQQPMLPKKPSEIRKDKPVLKPFAPANSEEPKVLSKPTPPVKLKPAKPQIPPKIDGGSSSAPTVGAKPGFPGVQLKPVQKPASSSGSSDISNGNGPSPPPKGSVKNIMAAFSDSDSRQTKSVPEKPILPGKPKPAVSAKPKPVIASKPLPAKKPGQNVNNLANSLSAKLSFNNRPQDNRQSAMDSATESSLRPSSQSSAERDSSVSNYYVALYDFVAENEGEISFNEGDDLEILETQGEWSLVRCWDEEGWAPTDYLQKA